MVKNRARDLLRAVADDGDVSIARVYDFARAVIEAPAFQTAQEILQGGSPELAVRKALELVSMVLSADDGGDDIVATIGGSYRFTEHWALELGVDYEYVPTDPVVTHEFMFALGGVFHF